MVCVCQTVAKNRFAKINAKSVPQIYTVLRSIKLANGQVVNPRLFAIISIRHGRDTESESLFPDQIQPNSVLLQARRGAGNIVTPPDAV